MNNELISIIIPVYNVELYLRRCLDSIINQTYKNTEILLINDGSTDNSELICKEYADKDNRVKLFTVENGGCSLARNFAMTKATGNYITFIDSDDFITPDYLEKLYKNLIENNADISICSYQYVANTDINKIDIQVLFDNKIEVYESKNEICMLLNQLFAKTFEVVVAWVKLFRREVLEGITFPVGKCFEDQFTIYKTYLKAKKVVKSREKNYFYCYNPTGLSNTVCNDNLYNYVLVFEERIKLYKECGFEKAIPYVKYAYFHFILNHMKVYNENTVICMKKVKELVLSCLFTDSNIKHKLKCIYILLTKKLLLRSN